jgi:hypothetical protein
MVMYKTILVLFVSLLVFNIHAQNGEVEIISDPRLEILVKKQGAIIPPATGPMINGYRIQLIFDSDRKVVDNARGRFIGQFPDVDTYILYSAPNYVLKVGDFRNHYEAEKIKDQFGGDFPTSFIIKEKINLPRIEPQ